MDIIQLLLKEIDAESATTRKMLQRVPTEHWDWKPHEKSMPFGRLASHVAEMFSWTPSTLTQPELDFSKFPADRPRIASWEAKWGDEGTGLLLGASAFRRRVLVLGRALLSG